MKKHLYILLLLSIILFSCDDAYTPKPRGYYRVSFPEKSYHAVLIKNQFSFQIADYARLDSSQADSGWYNIVYPDFKATIYLTYKQNVDIEKMVEESRSLVYKHSIKADDIVEQNFINAPEKVYGSIYDLKGNTATSLSFHIVDSISRYLRGSLYFYSKPNEDSIRPSVNFIEKDVKYLIENFKWER